MAVLALDIPAVKSVAEAGLPGAHPRPRIPDCLRVVGQRMEGRRPDGSVTRAAHNQIHVRSGSVRRARGMTIPPHRGLPAAVSTGWPPLLAGLSPCWIAPTTFQWRRVAVGGAYLRLTSTPHCCDERGDGQEEQPGDQEVNGEPQLPKLAADDPREEEDTLWAPIRPHVSHEVIAI